MMEQDKYADDKATEKMNKAYGDSWLEYDSQGIPRIKDKYLREYEELYIIYFKKILVINLFI